VIAAPFQKHNPGAALHASTVSAITCSGIFKGALRDAPLDMTWNSFAFALMSNLAAMGEMNLTF